MPCACHDALWSSCLKCRFRGAARIKHAVQFPPAAWAAKCPNPAARCPSIRRELPLGLTRSCSRRGRDRPTCNRSGSNIRVAVFTAVQILDRACVAHARQTICLQASERARNERWKNCAFESRTSAMWERRLYGTIQSTVKVHLQKAWQDNAQDRDASRSIEQACLSGVATVPSQRHVVHMFLPTSNKLEYAV